MSRILFINRFYYPDLSATSQLLTDLATEIAKTGQTVHVITGRRLYHDGEKTLPAQARHRGVEIHRIRTTNFNRFGLPGRALDFGSFYLMATIELLRRARRGDILVAKTDPPMMSVLVRIVGSLRRAKVINWLQDIFPEVAQQLGMVPRGYGVGNLLRGLRNWSLRFADANVVLGERMRQNLLDFGVAEERIHIIPNWSDGVAIAPLAPQDNPLRKAWGLEGKFVVIYSGNMGRAHNFDTIIEAAKQLKTHPEIVFLWVGGGVKKEEIQKAAKNAGLNNFLFKDYQPRETLRETLAVGDVHLVTLAPNLEGLIVPSKFYGALAAGRPVIFVGDGHGEIANIIAKHDCGYHFTENQASALARKLIELSRHPEQIKDKGEKARTLFEQSCGVAHSVERWNRLFNQVRNTRRRRFIMRRRTQPSLVSDRTGTKQP